MVAFASRYALNTDTPDNDAARQRGEVAHDGRLHPGRSADPCDSPIAATGLSGDETVAACAYCYDDVAAGNAQEFGVAFTAGAGTGKETGVWFQLSGESSLPRSGSCCNGWEIITAGDASGIEIVTIIIEGKSDIDVIMRRIFEPNSDGGVYLTTSGIEVTSFFQNSRSPEPRANLEFLGIGDISDLPRF